ncbi:MAG: 50S ribosomal protein L21 [Flavobacteriales bacterium]|nr:50S ribosomal protein L21 [Flavobacteriales bacterium]
MYAIVEIAGQQFKVQKDQQLYVHRLEGKEGAKVDFHDVLLIDDNGTVNVGAPAIDGAKVTAKILQHLKGDKVIVFKKKRRKGYQKKNGHRQYLTQIEIDSIVAKGAKKSVAKAEVKKEVDAVKAAAPKTAKAEVKAEDKPATTDLSGKTVAELKDLAKAAGITGISGMKKANLIEALSK